MHPLLPTFVTLALIIPLLCFIIYHGKGTAAHSKGDPVPSNSERPNVPPMTKELKPELINYVVILDFKTNYEVMVACFGSIISPNWILTTANCTFEKLYVLIYVGSHVQHNDKPIMNVSSNNFHMHENYVPNSPKSDIALIRTRRIAFSNTVNSIKLPDYGHLSDENSDENVFYVRIKSEDAKKETWEYQYKALRILDNTSECTGGADNNKEFICAPISDEILTSVFKEVEGHLLTKTLSSNRRILIGININVVETLKGTRFLYTSTSFFGEWIKKTMQKNEKQ